MWKFYKDISFFFFHKTYSFFKSTHIFHCLQIAIEIFVSSLFQQQQLLFDTPGIRKRSIHGILVQYLKRQFLESQKYLFERYDWDHLITDSLKPIHSIFCKSTVWSNESNAFCRSIRVITAWNPLSIPLKIKS